MMDQTNKPEESRAFRPAPCAPRLSPRAPCLLLSLFFVIAGPAFGAPASAVKAQSSTPGSLAEALLKAPAPVNEAAIAISAQDLSLPAGMTAPGPNLSVYQVAVDYGRIPRDFGGVIAIAPPTMVVLNAAPGVPQPFDGMPPSDALKLLVASLTPAQWHSLISAQGLGVPDLLNDYQRGLFLALFPGGLLKVKRDVPPTPGAPVFRPDNGRPVTAPHVLDAAALEGARLRLSRAARVALPTDKGFPMDSSDNDTEGGGPRYSEAMDLHPHRSPDVMYGVRIRNEMPNTPKPGNLDMTAAVLKRLIPLQGLATVDDLIARISHLTHVEIYADRRYGSQPILILGRPTEAPAAELLQAVAFCLTGTYRLVGPAFVLTDDLKGFGTRLQILAEFQAAAERARRGPVDQAGNAIEQTRSVMDLPDRPGSLTMTPAQLQQYRKKAHLGLFGKSISLRFDQLTPQQQEAARQEVANFARINAALAASPDIKAHAIKLPTPNLEGPIGLELKPTIELLTPSLDGPVNLDLSLAPDRLFESASDFGRDDSEPTPVGPGGKIRPAPPREADRSLPTLAASLGHYRRRALIVEAHTASDVDTAIASMPKLGFNELWLKVLAPGIPERPAAPQLDGAALLTEALRAAHGTDIRVLAFMDLFDRNTLTPVSLRDLNILGEQSPEAEKRERADSSFPPDDSDVPGAAASIVVCPFRREVQAQTESAVESAAAQPGLAGIVFQDPTPAGYGAIPRISFQNHIGELGYTEIARLSFLRQEHADPIDIDPGTQILADTWLPNLYPAGGSGAGGDSDGSPDPMDFGNLVNVIESSRDKALRKDWSHFRIAMDRDLLDRLRMAAGRLPVMVEVQTFDQGMDTGDGWYGAWAGGPAPLPGLDEIDVSGPTVAIHARAQCGIALLRLNVQAQDAREEIPFLLNLLAKNAPWDGLVVNPTDGLAIPAEMAALAK